jgi:radical SAM protein with 4Fe4S-binding SPASM domain
VEAAFKAPLYIGWELTHHCNAECIHCYSASGPKVDCSDELTTEEALNVIDQLAEAGLLLLAFSGGEPMLRKDWRQLVGHAVTSGLGVNIGTNGSTVTDLVAGELEQLGVKSVTVSVDSNSPEVHDKFRQFKGMHQHAMNAINRLVRHNIRVVVGFTPTRLNWLDGRRVIELAEQLGAHAVNFSEYVPAGRGGKNLAIEPHELRQVLSEWIGYREEFRGRIDVIWHDCRVGLLVPEGERRQYVGCGAGRLVARILPDGTVTPCVFLPTPIGNLRQTLFRDMWSCSPLLRQFRLRDGHIGGNCGNCEHLSSCGGCRSAAFAFSGGDPLAGDPYCWIESQKDCPTGLEEGESLPA